MSTSTSPLDEIAQTTEQAAELILKHSYAVLQVDDETATVIRNAWKEANSFLAGESRTDSSSVICEGHLLGFNEPTEAKYLFRSFVGHPEQPWPNKSLKDASVEVASRLHDILMDCFNHILDRKESKGKRKRQVDTSIDTQQCPLDYFYYHNRRPGAVNCSQHVDRGVLICVCLTNVPGLQVLNHRNEFLCPEHLVDKETSNLICIMAGDSLQSFDPNSKACMHRVNNKLDNARLSISYELRLKHA
jgi:hypothetical protein